ncbi:bifunctional riboflavin kinase/FAD synthetase [Marinomonas rhizomae]|uniref:Riboflavin biosynthesis protein n=1 Tax=Marinomonas rhizomae TaxID=491948 RepID=A0A366IVV5_9GAMM|nr:bifunctional riboflavin kinase/FAD synthetase [Marinomonas rhizomae]RBP78697.1 FMN adenylyltransferase /riboflavin kinase [Marinomonas rhizomae]RNF70651.1 bifunctional riboflavin kinase/FAD synthetase [Marinomonas rhizomae]
MELIRGIHNIRSKHRECVLTIGNFDGVHLGHGAILARVKALAKQYNSPAAIMIFEPQPREFFTPETAPGRIGRLRDKVKLLEGQGIDYVLCMPFNPKLQQLDAQAFCQQILLNGLSVNHLVVGDDFRFGCDRQGDFYYLQEFGSLHGFDVENTPSVLNALNERVSSTLVRNALERGDITAAQMNMGHSVTLSGRVIHGQQLGRKLGFPTANVHLKGIKSALSGVYAVTFMADGVSHNGVANIGVRPTVQGKTPILEVHLLDFSDDLYDKYVQVTFCHFIRAERKMASLDALEKQIQCDKEEALRFFANQ